MQACVDIFVTLIYYIIYYNLNCMGHTSQLRGMTSVLRMRTAISPMSQAVAAMVSCFGLVGPHQYAIARQQCRTRKFISPVNTCVTDIKI